MGLRALAICLVVAYFIVKGFLSWLADVSIWVLQILGSGSSLDPTDREFVDHDLRVQVGSPEQETRQPFLAPKRTESARSRVEFLEAWTEPKTTDSGIAGTPSEDRPRLLGVAARLPGAAPLIVPKMDSKLADPENLEHFENSCDYTLARLQSKESGRFGKWYFAVRIGKLVSRFFSTSASDKL